LFELINIIIAITGTATTPFAGTEVDSEVVPTGVHGRERFGLARTAGSIIFYNYT